MQDKNADPALVARCERIASLCALAVTALGLAVLIGWALEINVLKRVHPEWVPMMPNAALGLVLAGVSLAAAGRSGKGPVWRLLHFLPALAVTLLGLLTFSQYLFNVDFGIDQLLFSANPDSGRMAQATALGLACTGVALLLLNSCCHHLAAHAAAMAGTLIGTLALLGYTYGVAALYGIGAYSKIAVHAALGLVVINLGILLVRPRFGLTALVTSQTAGGVMLRRLLPLALVAPFVIGWLFLRGHQSDLFGDEFGIAVLTLTYLILFTAFIWRTAQILRKSDLKRFAAERAQRQQQAQLTGIIDSAMDGIIMVDAELRIVLFNPAAEKIFGYTAAQVWGGTLDVLLPPSARTMHSEKLRTFSANGAANRRMESETLTGLRASGEEFPVELSVSQLEVNGEKYFTAIVRDITESRRVQEALLEREAHLTLAMEVAKIGTWERNLATGAASCSAEGQAMLGLETDAYSLDEFLRHLHPEDLPRMRAALSTLTPDAPFEIEYRIVRPDGEIRWLNERGRVICDARGVPVWILGATHDVTERRMMEDELRASKSDAERANNAKSRFLAAASHDLRQPLSALSIYVNLLRGNVTPGGQAMLANLKDCIDSLSELLTDLLDLSKLEAGVVTPNPSDFSIADVLTPLVAIHAPEAELKGLRLRCVPTGLTAHTDPVLFKRVLGNFIDNAVRYTERGGVLIGCRRRGARVWLEVWDSGIGIAEDKTAEIFEEFRQLGDGARTRGSGLGLAIVAKTAALLGLEISVRSRPGRGSVFAIEVPLGTNRTAPAAEPAARPHRSLRVALVEDNVLVREALVSGLQAAGHRVLGAASGSELGVGLARFMPDIVVSDYRLMRGETGYDVITAARAATQPDLPAILITGDTDPRLVRSMADRGIIVLHKPLDMETLQAYLDDLTSEEELVLR